MLCRCVRYVCVCRSMHVCDEYILCICVSCMCMSQYVCMRVCVCLSMCVCVCVYVCVSSSLCNKGLSFAFSRIFYACHSWAS